MSQYTPPEVKVGDIVLWYDGVDVGEDGHPSVIMRARGVAIDCRQFSGQTNHVSVRHHTDPVLGVNDEIKKNGCWDFTSQQKQLDRVEEMVKKIMETNKKK